MFLLRQPYEQATTRATQRLTEAGLQVMRTFDLQSACADHPGGTCPHHGMGPCACRLGVLLVYGETSPPAVLMVHGYDEQTWFSVVDIPPQRADRQLEALIMQAMLCDEVVWSVAP